MTVAPTPAGFDPARAGKLRAAVAWLVGQLASGDRRAANLSTALADTGISERTLRRAKAVLGVASRQEADGWWWSLPTQVAKSRSQVRRKERNTGLPTKFGHLPRVVDVGDMDCHVGLLSTLGRPVPPTLTDRQQACAAGAQPTRIAFLRADDRADSVIRNRWLMFCGSLAHDKCRHYRLFNAPGCLFKVANRRFAAVTEAGGELLAADVPHGRLRALGDARRAAGARGLHVRIGDQVVVFYDQPLRVAGLPGLIWFRYPPDDVVITLAAVLRNYPVRRQPDWVGAWPAVDLSETPTRQISLLPAGATAEEVYPVAAKVGEWFDDWEATATLLAASRKDTITMDTFEHAGLDPDRVWDVLRRVAHRVVDHGGEGAEALYGRVARQLVPARFDTGPEAGPYAKYWVVETPLWEVEDYVDGLLENAACERTESAEYTADYACADDDDDEDDDAARQTAMLADAADDLAAEPVHIDADGPDEGGLCRLRTSFGSKLPARSRATLTSTGPTSVSTVLAR